MFTVELYPPIFRSAFNDLPSTYSIESDKLIPYTTERFPYITHAKYDYQNGTWYFYQDNYFENPVLIAHCGIDKVVCVTEYEKMQHDLPAPGYSKRCEHCGKEFWRISPCLVNGFWYCSYECAEKAGWYQCICCHKHFNRRDDEGYHNYPYHQDYCTECYTSNGGFKCITCGMYCTADKTGRVLTEGTECCECFKLPTKHTQKYFEDLPNIDPNWHGPEYEYTLNEEDVEREYDFIDEDEEVHFRFENEYDYSDSSVYTEACFKSQDILNLIGNPINYYSSEECSVVVGSDMLSISFIKKNKYAFQEVFRNFEELEPLHNKTALTLLISRKNMSQEHQERFIHFWNEQFDNLTMFMRPNTRPAVYVETEILRIDSFKSAANFNEVLTCIKLLHAIYMYTKVTTSPTWAGVIKFMQNNPFYNI